MVVRDELLWSKGNGHSFVAVVDPCEITDGGSSDIKSQCTIRPSTNNLDSIS